VVRLIEGQLQLYNRFSVEGNLVSVSRKLEKGNFVLIGSREHKIPYIRALDKFLPSNYQNKSIFHVMTSSYSWVNCICVSLSLPPS